MNTVTNALKSFFGVGIRGQTYLNTLYLMLAFPLGLFYFIFFVVGFSAGIPLVIVWVGLLILAGVIAAWYGMIAFERQLAIGLLREEIPPISRQEMGDKSLWQKFKAFMTNTVAWKGLVYLLARFPLGILSFVVLVTLLSLSLALIGAPFYYQYTPASIDLSWNGVDNVPVWLIDTLPEALIVSLVGILLLLVSLHIFNGMAWVSGKFARVMLGNFSEPAAVTAAPAAAVVAETTSAPEGTDEGVKALETPPEEPAEPAATGE